MRYLWAIPELNHFCWLPFDDSNERFANKQTWLYICHKDEYTEELLTDILFIKELTCLKK